MKELVVISGKGGTGKTSLVASLAALARPVVTGRLRRGRRRSALVLEPQVIHREDFVGGSKARVDAAHCTGCGRCVQLCRFGAVECYGTGAVRGVGAFRVDQLACEGCGVCADSARPRPSNWFLSSRAVVHLETAAVAPWSMPAWASRPRIPASWLRMLRRAARKIGRRSGVRTLIVDGSPGIGCPVIASLTGSNLALIVAEPTASGLHDFERVARLAAQLEVSALLVVNKADLNPDVTRQLEECASATGVEPIGRIPYDAAVTVAQLALRSVVEISNGPAAAAIRRVWQRVEARLQTTEWSSAPEAIVPLRTG